MLYHMFHTFHFLHKNFYYYRLYNSNYFFLCIAHNQHDNTSTTIEIYTFLENHNSHTDLFLYVKTFSDQCMLNIGLSYYNCKDLSIRHIVWPICRLFVSIFLKMFNRFYKNRKFRLLVCILAYLWLSHLSKHIYYAAYLLPYLKGIKVVSFLCGF